MNTDTSFVVVRADASDAQALAPVFEAYRAFYKKPADKAGAEQFLEDRLSRNEAVVFLARRDGVIVGFTLLYPVFSSARLGSLWLLNDLYVMSEARRSGIGRRLLAAARIFAEGTGAIGLTLRTALDNAAAQELYEKSGYERNDNFYTYDLHVER